MQLFQVVSCAVIFIYRYIYISCVLQAAGLLLRRWLATGGSGATLLGIHPSTGSVGNLSRGSIAVASLQAMERFSQVNLDFGAMRKHLL